MAEARSNVLRDAGPAVPSDSLPAMPTETPPRIRVLIADDHALIRIGLRSVLAEDSQIEIVGEAQDGREAVAMAQALEPDLVLMDVRMPTMGGLEATRALREVCPTTKVLILTSFEDEDILLEAVDAGVVGFVLKAGTERRLRSAVHDAADGSFPVDPKLLRALLNMHAAPLNPVRPAKVAGTLSPREREVLALLARGMTNRQIAHALLVTIDTAKVHVDHILAKLGVRDRTQAAIRGIELGYVTRRS